MLCEFWLLLARLARDQLQNAMDRTFVLFPDCYYFSYDRTSPLHRWIKEINLPPPAAPGWKWIRKMWELYHDKKSPF